MLPSPWGELFRSMEIVDAYFALAGTGLAWMTPRRAQIVLPGKWWWEIGGLRDRGDSLRYRGMWEEQQLVTVYYG